MKAVQFFETPSTACPRMQCHIPEDLKLQFYLVLYSPGHWVLLDEINLASAETLECLSGLLEGSTGSVYLLERGDQKPVERHRDFRLFACMNPATDVGKKDLPAGLRNRFVSCLCTCYKNNGKLHSFGAIVNIFCLQFITMKCNMQMHPTLKEESICLVRQKHCQLLWKSVSVAIFEQQ